MIQLEFIKKASLRRTFVENKKITFMTPEMNNQPIVLDINLAIEKQDEKMIDMLKQLGMDDFQKYKDWNDRQIADEIILDFKESGWRCIKNHDEFRA